MTYEHLFSPVSLGAFHLANRIVLAPMTRNRATPDGVPFEYVADYYSQRASGGLLISEATAISKQGSGYPVIPGIWTEKQVEAWSKITKSVHDAGGKILCQLWHTGRIAHSSLVGGQPVSSSAVAPNLEVFTAAFEKVQAETPRELTIAEIKQVVADYKIGAECAKAAGFDGVELHGANGYLIDQFLRDGVNRRTDEYGGSIENRQRFALEVLGAVIDVWGADRVGIRLSPFGAFDDMSDSDPLNNFVTILQSLKALNLAFVHFAFVTGVNEPDALKTFRDVYGHSIITNGAYSGATAEADLEAGLTDATAFGVPFLANPDLPERLKSGAQLNEANPATFYGGTEIGFTDYPTLAAS